VSTDRYLALARVPGALAFFCTSSLGRLGVAMSGLGLLATVRYGSGSFAVAEAVGAPHIARAMDRWGQRCVLAATALTHSAAVGGLLLALATTASRALPLLCALAALAGASLPRIGSASAVRWKHVLPDRELLTAAFALEAMSNDVAFLAGPALVVAVAGLTEPVFGSAVAVVLTAGGAVGLAMQHATAPEVRRAPRSHRAGSVWGRTMPAVLGVNLALGALFGSLQASVIAAAEEYRAAPWAGLVYSTMSAVSLVSGLAFGARRWSWPPQRVLHAVASFLVIAAALLQAVDGLALLAAVLALVGACIAPLLVLSALLTERSVPASELTRALTWTASSSAAGIAMVGGLAGIVVEAGGAAFGFLLTVAAAGLVAVAACFARAPHVAGDTSSR
jgi:hypothetical protein